MVDGPVPRFRMAGQRRPAGEGVVEGLGGACAVGRGAAGLYLPGVI